MKTRLLAILLFGLLTSTGCLADGEVEITGDSEAADEAAGAQELTYNAGASQFRGGFAPGNAPWGGFGGGSCSVTKTPVVFINGNGASAEEWDFPPVTAPSSVYDNFRAAGYNDCELFGVNWLSPTQRSLATNNFHDTTKRDIVRDFIIDVLIYTGAPSVDIVSHSMGVTISLEAVNASGLWPYVRRFVNISGALRGLDSCLSLGYANPAYPTCGSQNFFNSSIFGFHPNTYYAYNPRMGNGGFRDAPRNKSTRFYSINAGINDQFQCASFAFTPGCERTGYFDSYSNVRAQLDIGYGSTALSTPEGGDANGVGHFRARNNSGPILVQMLRTSCTGTSCCPSNYDDPCGE